MLNVKTLKAFSRAVHSLLRRNLLETSTAKPEMTKKLQYSLRKLKKQVLSLQAYKNANFYDFSMERFRQINVRYDKGCFAWKPSQYNREFMKW